MKWNKKKFTKNMVRLFVGLIGVWLFYSVIDFAFARSMYGGMWLSKYNIVVVLYKAFNNMLIGFKF